MGFILELAAWARSGEGLAVAAGAVAVVAVTETILWARRARR
ncbi:hypothetical protein [Streptomyces sp. STCH 565 A]|nr:hypothetical protein [Streptomyces sp. STCH 565 A]